MNKKKLLLAVGVIIVVIAAVAIYAITNKGGNNQQASLYNIPSSKATAISAGVLASANAVNAGGSIGISVNTTDLAVSSQTITTGSISMNSGNGSWSGSFVGSNNPVGMSNGAANFGKRYFTITPVTTSTIGGNTVVTGVAGSSFGDVIDSAPMTIPNGSFSGGYSGSFNGHQFPAGTSYEVRACFQNYNYSALGNSQSSRNYTPICGQEVLVTIPAAAAAIAPASGTLGQTCASWLQGTNYRTSFTGSNVMARSTYDPVGYGASSSSANSCAYLTPSMPAANRCSMKASTFSSSSSYPTSGCSNTFVGNKPGSTFNGEPITQSFVTTVQ